jgi:hypothetical protein
MVWSDRDALPLTISPAATTALAVHVRPSQAGPFSKRIHLKIREGGSEKQVEFFLSGECASPPMNEAEPGEVRDSDETAAAQPVALGSDE